MVAQFNNNPVPVIDLAACRTPDAATRTQARAHVARQIDEACRTIGFLVVTGHGVDPALVAAFDDAARRFFDLPMAVKQHYAQSGPEKYRGFRAMGGFALARTLGEARAQPDYRELYSFYRHRIDVSDPYFTCEAGRAVFQPNIYPDEVAELRPLSQAYYDVMTDLATDLMRLFALALGLAEDWFDDKVDKHTTSLTVSNYPDQVAPPLPGQLRAGAHTDYGSMTILRTEDKPGGLEVQDRAGAWHPVPVVPGAFIINIGDLMAQWTNDRWVSTMHRVVNPPRDSTGGTRRQSLIFFHQPNYDAEIRCIPTCLGDKAAYPPTTSGKHYKMKMSMMQVD